MCSILPQKVYVLKVVEFWNENKAVLLNNYCELFNNNNDAPKTRIRNLFHFYILATNLS